ncbi:acetate/propionate family kinase [Flavitalea sp. BT771]|uniref:acetate/propionate family kinase n=1 Tax=Flavitalea sp. BT771 TaxID=3063329 RepID=UPI0026E35BD8|nr:acetate/propionate family kinase [Flavitalea sp. BT771]MDO6429526.1 acetate/propionate family kinase [Flavitalea sp. BT771]MDV6218346.1 acetate/propionate family kinase [Flavitalea sp. BT771]
MQTSPAGILTINGGSSSIKFSVYGTGDALQRLLHGKIERIGLADPLLSYAETEAGPPVQSRIEAADLQEAARFLVNWLEQKKAFAGIKAIGHRVVHGLEHVRPALVTEQLLKALRGISTYDPDHLPGEIILMELFREKYPQLPQVACFDTAFHADIPRIARLLPIPRRYDEAGIRRYGFHGLSYSYILGELGHLAGKEAAEGRLIIAHLGSGASLAAIYKGRCMDTSMGFTPAGGIMMGSRPGDLDPGVAWYMIQKDHLDPAQFNALINHQCGLLGVSGTSGDMRDLLQQENEDVRAAEAVELFCYQVKKQIGAYSAVLGGIDTLVFTGGIGENLAVIRSRICQGLEYLGLGLDEGKNKKNDLIISSGQSRTTVYVIPTDEEKMIAKNTSFYGNI